MVCLKLGLERTNENVLGRRKERQLGNCRKRDSRLFRIALFRKYLCLGTTNAILLQRQIRLQQYIVLARWKSEITIVDVASDQTSLFVSVVGEGE